jgi:D-alanyl-D-alanine carboxypeptidase/D-alanyl-D-alanine-endopeptidase (penicillin-binding protein 4)
MKKLFLITCCCTAVCFASSQDISQKLVTAYQQFASDTQMRHAISSLYVVNAKTGAIVFDRNSQLGLAAASTQKIVTATTAFELLGKDYRYKTYIGYDIGIKNGELLGNLYFEGNGDPTLGSMRWPQTKDTAVFRKIIDVLKKNQVKKIRGDIWIDDLKFGINPLPDGWIWQDIGNYYGAGSWGFNWQENQYDLVLKAGPSVQTSTEVVKTNPYLYNYNLGNLVKTGEKGSGDNGYIYYPPYSNRGFATGTIPAGEKAFTISGSVPHPAKQFGLSLAAALMKEKIPFSNKVKTLSDSVLEGRPVRKMMQVFDSISSPPLDSIVYWFLRRSINFYGETLLRTLAKEQLMTGSTDGGVLVVKNFWRQKGMDVEELNIKDGSGLSPENRITTHAQVEILKYASQQPWYPSFYDALPEFNNMKMKSGTISDVKAFCGYQHSSDGNDYIFSFIVNNYSGSGITAKMYRVLDVLK